MTRAAAAPTVLKEITGPGSCEMCGAPGLKTQLVRNPFLYGTGSDAVELSADMPVHTCNQCDLSYTGEEAENIEHDVVCRHLDVLTADEIKALRDRYGLSRAEFSRFTGFGEATLARWERREVIQNTSSDRYLRLLQDSAIFQRLRSLVGMEVSGPLRRTIALRAASRFPRLTGTRERQYRSRARHFSPSGLAAS